MGIAMSLRNWWTTGGESLDPECHRKRKNADVVDHPKVINHVGLLINAPANPCRRALYLVVRQYQEAAFEHTTPR
jgi:hypothetical protein